MKLPGLAAALLVLLATPAQAEKLTFDHRLSPPLKAVLDSGDAAKVYFNAANPRYVVDRIAVRGASANDWQEALEIIARTPGKGMGSPADWMAELRAAADKACPNLVTTLSEDPSSVTFERQSQPCGAERAPYALYRVVGSKRSLFLLAVLSKQPIPAESRAQWLAMLASAHIE